MPATVRRVDLAHATLQRELTGPRGLVTRYVMRQVRAIRNRAVLYCPVDTGNLRASITSAVSSPVGGGGLVIEGRVGTPVEYAVAVHEGNFAMSVTVPAHSVKAHQVKARAARRKRGDRPAVTARAAYTRAAHMRKQHWRTIPARAGRPFLRRAMNEVLANPA